jgi:hypothetical protein
MFVRLCVLRVCRSNLTLSNTSLPFSLIDCLL